MRNRKHFKIEVDIKTENNNNEIFTMTVKPKGIYLKESGFIELTEQTIVFSLANRTREECTQHYLTELKEKMETELVLKGFIQNIKEYGYSRLLALEEVMEQGYKLGFHYDLMGCADILRINKKSLTIEDITDTKHYVDKKYLNELELSQFYVTV